MKEYIAETGGRYTYSDDILNLQELALSMSAIFDGCSNFIISGCEVSGPIISPGYVWINGKIRRYNGCNHATYPHYLYEVNYYDTVTYANDINKKGRCSYLCESDKGIPEKVDQVTLALPQFIEVTPSYAPRFIDKFIGKYAVLLETPFSKQTIKKDIVFSGKVNGDKDIESKTAISVFNETNGYSLRNVVKASGEASVGAYLNGLLLNEIVIHTDGSFSFVKGNKVIAKVSESGFTYTHSITETSNVGSLMLYDSNIINRTDNTDTGAVNINFVGYEQRATKYRDFNVFDGKLTPLFGVTGKTGTTFVHGEFYVKNSGKGIELSNTDIAKADAKLTNTVFWTDRARDVLGLIGYASTTTFDFTVKNLSGNIILSPTSSVNVAGELHVNGKNISGIYVSQTTFGDALKKKVDVVEGKQLSSQDFTSEHKKKLEAISLGVVGTESTGYVTAKDVTEALGKKLTASKNLQDLTDAAIARVNLDVYSTRECSYFFLSKSNHLLELVTLTAEEVNGLTTEEITALKLQKQATVRNTIDAEKKGTGDLKLAKSQNLSDLPDKTIARKNMGIYSIEEVNKLLEGKLSNDSAYSGIPFTSEHKNKLEGIKTGNFAGVDSEGKSIAQTEGYALISAVVKEIAKKANLLLDGYNDSQKKTIASNIGLYTQKEADDKFVSIESLMQDYITHLVKQGKTTTEAQKLLRDKLDAPSNNDVTDNYLRKDGKLSDLSLPTTDAKKQACRVLGAAYAEEYQTKVADSGWLQMANSGNSTDTSKLYIRQIGNIVCIQGILNTGKKDGSHWGGTAALIPNSISPPKHGLRQTYCDFNDDHSRNRGISLIIQANSRKMIIYESGWPNVNTEINFSYMT